jgi:hypothetical protein
MGQDYSIIVSFAANSPEDAEEVRDEIAGSMEDARDSDILPDGCDVDVGDVIPRDIERVLAKYRTLFDGISDMIEDGRLSEADIPDDYLWLTTRMTELAGIDEGTENPSFRDLSDVNVDASGSEDIPAKTR